jgi:hypothetical protein
LGPRRMETLALLGLAGLGALVDTGLSNAMPRASSESPAIRIYELPLNSFLVKRGTARFTFRVTNTGDVTLTSVAVADPRSPGCSRSLGTMLPGAAKAYTCAQPDVTAPYTNVAFVVGISPAGRKVRDSDAGGVSFASESAAFTG